MPAIVVDVGGTYLRCGVTSDGGLVSAYQRRRIPNFLSSNDCGSLWQAIIEMIAVYIRDVECVMDTGREIVFAVPGPVAGHSRLVRAPTITGDRDRSAPDVGMLLSERTGRLVYLVNDVAAATWYIADQIADERFFVVTVSSGIGSKLYDRAHPERVYDVKPFAGEVGHIVVDHSSAAPICDCGGRGHLGAISSGRGTERLARRAARADLRAYRRSLVFHAFGVEPGQITNEDHLVPAALAGDAWARGIIEAAAQPLAKVLSVLIVAAGLDRVVVMGGFAQQLGAVYREALGSNLSSCLDPTFFPYLSREQIHMFDAGEEVSLAGAAALFRDRRGLTV